MTMVSAANWFNRAKPFLAIIFLQFGYAGMSIITKSALNEGMNLHAFIVYRHVVATVVIAPLAIVLDRKVRPKLTLSVFAKIALLGFLEPVMDQNLFYTGMKYTTATFATAMCNIIPALAFLMAWVFRLEKVQIKSLHSQAKIWGTVVTVGGAMLMTLVQGPSLNLPWTKGNARQESEIDAINQDSLKGSLMILAGCFCWSCFFILQAITLKSYPAELSLTVLICFMGAVQSAIVALIFERGNPVAWSIQFDAKLLAFLYGGVVCSGLAYFIQGMVMKQRGPVFVTAFNPVNMVLVAVMSSLILGEIMYTGRIIGAVVIIGGLYMVLWGKSKDAKQTMSGGNEAEPAAPELTNKMESTTSSNPGFVAIAVTNIKSTDDGAA